MLSLLSLFSISCDTDNMGELLDENTKLETKGATYNKPFISNILVTRDLHLEERFSIDYESTLDPYLVNTQIQYSDSVFGWRNLPGTGVNEYSFVTSPVFGYVNNFPREMIKFRIRNVQGWNPNISRCSEWSDPYYVDNRTEGSSGSELPDSNREGTVNIRFIFENYTGAGRDWNVKTSSPCATVEVGDGSTPYTISVRDQQPNTMYNASVTIYKAFPGKRIAIRNYYLTREWSDTEVFLNGNLRGDVSIYVQVGKKF